MMTIEKIRKTITYEEYIPHIIESSFGIDRILYAIFSHNFWLRKNDETKKVLLLPKVLAPYNISIFGLRKKDNIIKLVNKIRNVLITSGFSCYSDSSNVSIGKKYVRSDEIGINYVITVDPNSLEDNKVTIRTLDMKQTRVCINMLVSILKNMFIKKEICR